MSSMTAKEPLYIIINSIVIVINAMPTILSYCLYTSLCKMQKIFHNFEF